MASIIKELITERDKAMARIAELEAKNEEILTQNADAMAAMLLENEHRLAAEAQAAVMRAALDAVKIYFDGDLYPEESLAQAEKMHHAVDRALSTDAGKDMLERILRLEKGIRQICGTSQDIARAALRESTSHE